MIKEVAHTTGYVLMNLQIFLFFVNGISAVVMIVKHNMICIQITCARYIAMNLKSTVFQIYQKLIYISFANYVYPWCKP